MQERLVLGCWRGQETGTRSVNGDIVVGLLCRESSSASFGRVCVFHVNEVHLHLLRSLDTDDQGGTLSSSHDLMWEVNRLEEQAICTLKLFDDRLREGGEVNVWVLVIEVLRKLRNALSVCVGLETEASAFEKSLQFLVVGDDTIVDDSELPFGIRPILLSVSVLLVPRPALSVCTYGDGS